MQNAAFAARGLDWAYVALDVQPDRLAEAVRGLAAAGFAGANVTTPHKVAVLELCDELDDVAARAESVNTLVIADGRIYGASTDAQALDGIDARRAVVLGAGGAARAWRAALEQRGSRVPRRRTRDGARRRRARRRVQDDRRRARGARSAGRGLVRALDRRPGAARDHARGDSPLVRLPLQDRRCGGTIGAGGEGHAAEWTRGSRARADR